LLRRPWHPLLFAVYPPLMLFAANSGLLPFYQLAEPTAWVLGAVVVAWLVLWLIFRNSARAAVVVSVGTLGFFSYGAIFEFLTSWQPRFFAVSSIVLIVWGVAWLTVIVVAGWRRRSYEQGTRFLNVVAVVLLTFPLLSIVQGVRMPQSGRTAVSAEATATPSIFYIVLDGYARQDALMAHFGLDNEPFLGELENRGFFIGREASANYLQTQQALASTLNMAYLQDLEVNPRNLQDRDPLNDLVDDNRVARELRARGYTYAAIRTGFPYFRFQSADVSLGDTSGAKLLKSTLVSLTPLRTTEFIIQSRYESQRQIIHAAFENLVELAKPGGRPKFVVAHVMAPHPPFVFGANGEPVQPKRPYSIVDGSHFFQHGGSLEEYREGYGGQLTYLNKLTLEAVDGILRYRKDAVIILQSDHGPKSRLDHDSLENTDLTEVLPILNAMRVPEPVRKLVYPSMTPVNTFRALFTGLFGEPFPLLLDDSFYATWENPYDFRKISLTRSGEE
jgi:hypothetical protein